MQEIIGMIIGHCSYDDDHSSYDDCRYTYDDYHYRYDDGHHIMMITFHAYGSQGVIVSHTCRESVVIHPSTFAFLYQFA